ncbi:LOW QUALITY PROTEIN: cytosolic beta-glucosidase-like [Podargus strigoides]
MQRGRKSLNVNFASPKSLSRTNLIWPVPEDIAFPAGFASGTATAPYQIEEGWNADGKGPNVWDTFTHQGGDRVFKNQTGDVACGSYTLWEEDLKCIKQLGLTHYRFSLSWSRLLPDGTTGFINQKGVNYYSKIINNLGNGILLTYHFDLPQSLEDEGGWRSEKIVETFDIHAKYCFRTFGDVITINELYVVATGGCEKGIAPVLVPELTRQLRMTAFTDGEYPAVMKSWISAMHSKQGYLSPRPLEFTKEAEDTYNNPLIYITENGFFQSDPALLDDSQPWEYFRLILQENFKRYTAAKLQVDAKRFVSADMEATSNPLYGCLTPPHLHCPQARRGRLRKVLPHFPKHYGLEASFTTCLDRNTRALANPRNF